MATFLSYGVFNLSRHIEYFRGGKTKAKKYFLPKQDTVFYESKIVA